MSNLNCLNTSPESWEKEDIELWLDSIGLTHSKVLFEKNKVTKGTQLKYLDKSILDNEFSSMSELDKKMIIGEIKRLFQISEEIPKGIWRAFATNPRATTFLLMLYQCSPRLTYMIFHFFNPNLIQDVLQEETHTFDIRMLIFPELLMAYKVYTLYLSSHLWFSILCIAGCFVCFAHLCSNLIKRQPSSMLNVNILIFYGLACLILPELILMIDIYTIGLFSHIIIYFTFAILPTFLFNYGQGDQANESDKSL
jgi:hypothetical protein